MPKARCRNHEDCGFHGFLQALWQLWVAPELPRLEALKTWLEAMFALGELHRSPVLLPRASTTGFLLIPSHSTQKLPGENRSSDSSCLSISKTTAFACQHILQIRDSLIQPGQLVSSHIFWSAGKPTTPKGSPSVYTDHPETTFNKLTFNLATQKMLLHYKSEPEAW